MGVERGKSSLSGFLPKIYRFLRTLDPAEADVLRLKAPVWLLHLSLFTLGLCLIVSRRPDLLTRAQFWAEDGRTWYMDAYNSGFASFGIPCAGSLVVFPRIYAVAVQRLPLTFVPLTFNLVAASCHVFTACFLFTSRMRAALPKPWTRWIIAAIIISLPGSDEVLANLSNVHNSHLPLLAAMILLMAKPSRVPLWRIVDVTVVAVCGLSGPFCEALLPLVFIRWFFWKRHSPVDDSGLSGRRWLVVLLIIVLACSIMQFAMLHSLSAVIAERSRLIGYPTAYNMARHLGTTGATPLLFIQLYGGKVIFSSLFGDNLWYELINNPKSQDLSSACAAACAILASLVTVRSLLPGRSDASSLNAALFIAFCWVIFAASLAYPIAAPDPNWRAWTDSFDQANRYWFIPSIGFFASLCVVASKDPAPFFRKLAISMLALALLGAVSEWEFFPWKETSFRAVANYYDNAPPGTKVKVLCLPDYHWTFDITKR